MSKGEQRADVDKLANIVRCVEGDGGRTFREVGLKFSVSAERARQLYRLAKDYQQKGVFTIPEEELL